MKKTGTIIAVAMGILILAACHKKGFPTATKDAHPAATYTPQQLADGQKVYDQHCDKCHEFHEPAEFTARKWGKILPSMIEKAELTKKDAEVLTAWVNANAKSS